MVFVFFFLRTGWVGPLGFVSGLLFLFLYFFFYIGALTNLTLLNFKDVTLCDSSKLVVTKKMWPFSIIKKSAALSSAQKISRRRRLLPTDWSPGGDRNALTEDKGSSRKYFSARPTTSANWRCAKISLQMVTSFISLQPGSKLHSMMTASLVRHSSQVLITFNTQVTSYLSLDSFDPIRFLSFPILRSVHPIYLIALSISTCYSY